MPGPVGSDLPESPEKLLERGRRLAAESAEEQFTEYLAGGGPPTGYTASIPLLVGSLPHKRPPALGTPLIRPNGAITLTLLSDRLLPCGIYPRLLLVYLCTEVLTRASRRVQVYPTQDLLMEHLRLTPSGGRQGTRGRFLEQLERLLRLSFHVDVVRTFRPFERSTLGGLLAQKEYRHIEVASGYRLWSELSGGRQGELLAATVEVGEVFYHAIQRHPVPINLNAIHNLRSSLAIDLYCWCVWRIFNMRAAGRSHAEIPYEALAAQFGIELARPRDLRRTFSRALKKVIDEFPQLRASLRKSSLILRAGPLPVPPRGLRF